ncbi:MAG TPA: ABC transporter permease [Dictyoglomaceae bacterium]|nr:ABC transporter permease [Dictyoglomaceae bacterium]
MIRYFIRRVIVFLLVVIIGVTIIFFIPRAIPQLNPVEVLIRRIQMSGQYMDPNSIELMRESLTKLYGLEGGIFEQYIRFWQGLLAGDLGPSFSSFPTPVINLIKVALPWTIGLLATTTILSWIIGTILGALAGYSGRNKTWSRIFETLANAVRPVPYYILALVLLLLFSYIWPIFPTGGGSTIGYKISFDLKSILIILKHAILPAVSLLIIGIGSWFLNMRNLTALILKEEYVTFAQLAKISDSIIFRKYVMRNALLPQITGLALQLGLIFNGTIITELVFSYPGLGTLIYEAINTSDYNVVMGVSIFSIVAVSLGTLIIDILSPLIDPRVRYR